jgi:thiol:disulfide interchange protein DsbA
MNMKRREFSQVAAGAALASTGLWSPLAQAQPQTQYTAGKDYHILDARTPVEAPAGKIEVVEFFLVQLPALQCLRADAGCLDQAHSQGCDRAARSTSRFAMTLCRSSGSTSPSRRWAWSRSSMPRCLPRSTSRSQALNKADDIAAWVAKQGVDKAKFLEQYNSFSVSTKSGKGTQLQNTYKVEGVPALGVAGRFYTDGAWRAAWNVPCRCRIPDSRSQAGR